ncbi:MAG TPA: AMP-binding protein [Rudaea sp.]|nr:AMP-binding protein [Rudaea sp.]
MNFTNLFDEARRHERAEISAKQIDGQDRSISFPAFVAEVDVLAQKLQTSGVARGMQIALQAPNCYEYLLWDLAALKLGAVIHAVPEDLPAEKVAAIARKHAIALWVYEKPENVAGIGNAVALAETAAAREFPVDRDAARLADADLHSRVYSSGSSGYLKGLEISRRGTELLVSDFIDAFGLCSADSHLIFLPLSNYQQRLSVYGCLWAGASIKVVRHTTVFQELGRYAPSFIIAPPAIYETVYNLYGRGADAKQKLAAFLGGNIRFMITGMAPIRKEVLKAFNALGYLLLEAYGVTETGMIAWNTKERHRIGAVGMPIHPEHVHFTAESEIVIKRPFPLSKCYFDSAESDSANTFLPDGSIATGDIGVLDADGFLSLSGRKKEIIVTSGGAKFHPEELERALSSVAPVKHSIVLMSKNDSRLVAVIVADGHEDPVVIGQIDESIRAMNASAPSYKNIHRRIVTATAPSIENGMLTRNLKYDRKGIYRYFEAEIEAREASLA